MPLSEQERLQINALVSRFESATGVEAVAAYTAKADAYPEIPWKAFALGSSLAALAAALHPGVIRIWSDTSVAALDAMLVIGTGVVLAILAAFVPAVGRMFLDRVRAQAEALQYAQSVFLERELFRTRARRAVLVVTCRFEGIAVVIVDSGLAQYAPAAELSDIGAEARALLRRGELHRAFELAFDRVRELLERGGFQRGDAANEIGDDVVMEKGA